jgi:hypothetical protein
MTIKRAGELLPTIKAFSEGKMIQYRGEGETLWTDIENPDWFNHLVYRIKPEPREFWIVPSRSPHYIYTGLSYDSESDARRANSGMLLIHVKEVL